MSRFYFFSIGVDSSIGMKKDEYFFIYKNTEFSYRPAYKKHETDNFSGRFDIRTDVDSAYKLMCEFLSAFSFQTNARVVPHPGLSTQPLQCSIKKYTGGYARRREIAVDETMDEFYYIPLVETAEQQTLIRLWRQSRSANNIYHALLFFWHILVYPSQKDEDAVAYIDKAIGSLSGRTLLSNDPIKAIISNPIFMPKGGIKGSLGEYIQKGARHSIAHIVRDNKLDAKSLELDLLSEETHLYYIVDILKRICRNKLEVDYDLKRLCPAEIFRYFNPDAAISSSSSL
jgi:hypothetical protein